MRVDDVAIIISTLNDADVRYLVVGGLAVVVHGYVRFTDDIDLVVQLDSENVRRAMNVLQGLGYRPLVPVDAAEFADAAKRERWRTEKNMKVFQLTNSERPDTRVDLFVYEPFDFDDAYRRAPRELIFGSRAPIVPLAELLDMKRAAGRPKDLGDIGELEVLKRHDESP